MRIQKASGLRRRKEQQKRRKGEITLKQVHFILQKHKKDLADSLGQR